MHPYYGGRLDLSSKLVEKHRTITTLISSVLPFISPSVSIFGFRNWHLSKSFFLQQLLCCMNWAASWLFIFIVLRSFCLLVIWKVQAIPNCMRHLQLSSKSTSPFSSPAWSHNADKLTASISLSQSSLTLFVIVSEFPQTLNAHISPNLPLTLETS